jgi:hypothetical protein
MGRSPVRPPGTHACTPFVSIATHYVSALKTTGCMAISAASGRPDLGKGQKGVVPAQVGR